MRSISIPEVPHPRYEDGINRKSGAAPRVSPITQISGGPMRKASSNAYSKELPGPPQVTRRVGRHRESLDLDEIMGYSDEEAEVPPRSSSKAHGTHTSSSSVSALSKTSSKTQGQPHVSKAARDLIAFLEEGPPDEPHFSPSPSVNASVISFESSKTKSGRLHRMMSLLTVGSNEKLNGRPPSEDSSVKTYHSRSISRKQSGKVGSLSSPPPSFMQSSLSSKRSLPSVIVATPPPPQSVVAPITAAPSPAPAQLSTPPMSSASSSQASVDEMAASTTSPRRTVRKAVPTLEDRDGFPMPPSSPLPPFVPAAQVSSSYGVEPMTPKTPVRRTTNGYARAVDTLTIDAENIGLEQSMRVSPSPRPANVPPKSSTAKADGQEGRPVSPKSALPSPVGPRPFVTKPRTPTTPTSSAEKSFASPRITASAADDLRQLLALATSADECRLLVDIFLARQGIPYKSPSINSSISEDVLAKVASHNTTLENIVVEVLLGGGDIDEADTQSKNVANDDFFERA